MATKSNDSTVQRVAREIASDGFSLVADLLDAKLSVELEQAISKKIKSDPDGKSIVARNYIRSMLKDEDFNSDGIFVRYALQPRLVAAVTEFFGEVPWLLEVEFFVSRPTEPGCKLSESQLWHRDHDDSKILKLFVYFNDVLNPGDGPFTFLPPSKSRLVKNTFIPGRVEDKTVAGLGLDPYIKEVYGKKGAAFFIDTARCYHMGSRCTTQNRFAYSLTFTTMAPLYPRDNRISIMHKPTRLEALLLET